MYSRLFTVHPVSFLRFKNRREKHEMFELVAYKRLKKENYACLASPDAYSSVFV